MVRSCRECVCTLLCYWSPTEDLCTSCLSKPKFKKLFLHHQQCPQGWVFSAASSSCFKAFNQEKPWKFANNFCQKGGGLLAQPKSSSTIKIVLEAINLMAVEGRFWLGGNRNTPLPAVSTTPCNPLNDNFSCCNPSNPCNLGEGDCDYDTDCAGNLTCGKDNCAAGETYMDCCMDTSFIWTGGNSVVDEGNWAHGFPMAGQYQT